ncbi:MAG: hypothetical protein C0397_00975 [Odoribacter sp.]|nr:hypothetical protein [Odoribacter sp.]
MQQKYPSSESDQERKALLSILEDEKLAKVELQKSEERLRLSTEFANVAVWEYDTITGTMICSKNHDKLYGLELQEKWDFNTYLNATHPDDRENSQKSISNLIANGGPDHHNYDFRVIYPDQSIHWLMVTGQVVERNADGQGILVRGTLIDITERKQAEEALISAKVKIEESEIRFKEITNQSTEGITLADTHGNYKFVNPAFCSMLGYSELQPKKKKHNGIFSGMSNIYRLAEKWVEYSKTKDEMFKHTDLKQSPWYVVPADNKKLARLNCISHLLSQIPYEPVPSEPIVLPPRKEYPAYVRPPITDQTFVPDRYSRHRDKSESDQKDA